MKAPRESKYSPTAGRSKAFRRMLSIPCVLWLGLTAGALLPETAVAGPGDTEQHRVTRELPIDDSSGATLTETGRTPSDRVHLCHRASRQKYLTIVVSGNAVAAHLGHGDCFIDDGIDCTLDRCDPVLGCVHEPNDRACDDGLFCTTETCTDEGCIAVSTCPPMIDGCVLVNDSCNEDNDVCVNRPDDSQCDDGNACTLDACDGETGDCFHEEDACDDGDLCTVDDCDPLTGCTHAPADCDDGDPCTQALCDSETGECVPSPAPDGTLCDDGLACTSGEFCLSGVCGNGVPNCPEGPNYCNWNLCDPETGECRTQCDPDVDGDQCRCVGDTCVFGVSCTPSPNQDCFENVCITTQGSCESRAIPRPPRDPICDGVSGCTTHADCADNDACTDEACIQDGVLFRCIYPRKSCNDNNPCTDDYCDPRDGCHHLSYNPIVLCGDDGIACTVGLCDPAVGCVHEPDQDACDDGLACTLDVCNADSGCSNSPDPALCGNGVCDLDCLEHAGNCPADCIGENSCIGDSACLGVTGQIGANSCHGSAACAFAGGIIGDNSCYSFLAFSFGACNSNTGDIGNNSCVGESACNANSGTIGDNSCRSVRACCGNDAAIEDNQCNHSCECFGPVPICAFDCGG